MDAASYKSLITKTQEALSSDAAEDLLVTSCATLIEDCSTCINQIFYVVTEVLSETEVCITKLTEYLSDAVCLLELLANYIKTIIGSEMVTCCVMKTFPTSIGLIIVTVFSHCKDSKPLYGSNLTNVEKQLRNLFRNCHALQVTYLMILEKNFIFNLTDVEEKNVLLEALDINLRIGEIVQPLDVKTLAVQWKTLVLVYEKYSAILYDTNIFQKCMTVLCSLIRSNIKTAVDPNEGDIVAIRSLKVANFLIKTLQKTCDVFGDATNTEYNNVIDLLFYIHETSLETTAVRSQFINLIASPSDCLLKKLLNDEAFGNKILYYDVEENKHDGSFLGYVLTVTSVMDCLTQGQEYKTVTKCKLIHCLYSILTECNSLVLLVDVPLADNQSERLFQHLLIHALALTFTLNCEEYNLLEKFMAEAIFSSDHVTALFSSHLWVLQHTTREINPQLLFNQIIWLSTMYKKLEKHSMFHLSPQKLHLAHTISRLFALMEDDDKMKICKQYRIHDDDNLALWAAFGVKNLPKEAKNAAEAVAAEKLKTMFHFNNSKGPAEINELTKVMSLAATCTFTQEGGVGLYIMKAWSKTCSKQQFIIEHVDGSTVWFYEYLQALIALTDSTWHRLCVNNANVIKILHYLTSLIQQTGVELKLLLINTLCKIATTDICESKLDDLTAAFTCLYETSEIVRNKMFITSKQYAHKNIDRILSNGDHSLRESWSTIKDCSDFIGAVYMEDIDLKYTHKCLENSMGESSTIYVSELVKESSANFDFLDNVDYLFRNDSDVEESACKKVKLDSSVVEAVIKRLETDTALLSTMKENVFSAECKSRILKICDELNSII